MIRFFNPAKGYLAIKEEIDSEITRVLTAGDLILRKDVEAFEMNLAAYVGTKYAVALNSGTDALYLALRYLGIGEGDEVLVPGYTFVATAQVVKQLGAKPVLYDLSGYFEHLITENTRAIIPVHMEGMMCDMKYVLDTINYYNSVEARGIMIIEDACQSLGAKYDNKMAGSFGIAGAFSFYPAKILGAYGDAGALVTSDEKLYKWVMEARNHFKNDASDWGINSRMDNLQAAILNVKMKYLPQAILARDSIANHYNENLDTIKGLTLPVDSPTRVYQDYIVRTNRRDALYDFLKEKGIETLKNEYPFPIPKPYQVEAYELESLRLPCNETLEKDEVDYVIKSIHEFFKQ